MPPRKKAKHQRTQSGSRAALKTTSVDGDAAPSAVAKTQTTMAPPANLPDRRGGHGKLLDVPLDIMIEVRTSTSSSTSLCRHRRRWASGRRYWDLSPVKQVHDASAHILTRRDMTYAYIVTLAALRRVDIPLICSGTVY